MRRVRGPGFIWVATVVTAVCAVPPLVAQSSGAAALRLEPCRLRGDVAARCGTLQVFENRETGEGRRIGIRVAVLDATGPARQPDPVFILQGGPGQAATDLGEFYGGASWTEVRRTRDIVLVDQRGTGQSNRLDCPIPGADASPQKYLGDLFPVEELRACRRRLEARADLRLYTTSIAMDDLEDIRSALGYDRINLYGTSYGTRAALVYQRTYPDRVRSMVLKGVAPFSMVFPTPFARDAQRSLDALFADCAAERACKAAFPQLKQNFAAVMTRLDRSVVAVTITDPVTRGSARLTLSRGLVTSVLRSALQSTTASARLPLVIHRAATGDYSGLAELALTYRRAAAADLSTGMLLSVGCSEDAPLIDRTAAADEARGTFMGTYWVDQFLAACEVWPRGDVPRSFRARTPAEAPALLISGFLDPATPPSWGTDALRSLTNHKHVIVRNGSHSFSGLAGCVDRIIAAFVAAGSVDGLDDSCADEIKRPPFVTKLAAR